MANNPKKSGSGFAFGVALGAMLGTGAMLWGRTKDGKKIVKKIEEKTHQGLDAIKEKYPQESKEFEAIVDQALAEAKQATQEISQLAKDAQTNVKSRESFIKAAKAFRKKSGKRFFSRSGKKLSKPKKA